MINLRKTANSETIYSKNDLSKGVRINCRYTKIDFKKAELKEKQNYTKQYGMGDKRNWSSTQ